MKRISRAYALLILVACSGGTTSVATSLDAGVNDATVAADVDAKSITKMRAAGIVVLIDDQGDDAQQVIPFSNPNVDGAKIRAPWSLFESQAGVYDWQSLDAFLAQAVDAGKFIGLEIVAGGSSPNWLYDLPDGGAKAIAFTAPTGADRTMPNPWDPVFLDRWRRFLSALAMKYDSSPNVAYITVSGLGSSTETILPPPYDASSLGSWAEAGTQIVDLYSAAFPNTPFDIAFNEILKDTNTLSTTTTVVTYGMSAAPGRFGAQYQGLNATATLTSSPDGPFNLYVHEFADASSPGFQMVCAEIDPSVCKAKWINGTLDAGAADGGVLDGALAASLVAGANLGAHWIEVYATDVADDANADALHAARVLLLANAGIDAGR